MHTLSPFYSITFSPSAPSLIFCLFDSTPVSPPHSLSVFMMVCHIGVTYSAALYNVSLCMYMYMHICMLTFLDEYMWYVSESDCHFLLAVYYHMSKSQTTCMSCGLANLSNCLSTVCLHLMLSLSPYHWPLWGCPHLQAVAEWARCVGVGRRVPGDIQTVTSCMYQCWRWQPIWGYEEREKRWWEGDSMREQVMSKEMKGLNKNRWGVNKKSKEKKKIHKRKIFKNM